MRYGCLPRLTITEPQCPRPTLKDQRSAEILDAYLTCVARFGLKGSTQDRIAAEAGVKRPLLRHYLGNRDDMTAALADHVINALAGVSEAVSVQFGSRSEPSELIDALFDDGHGHDPRLRLAWKALATTAEHIPDLRPKLTHRYADFLAVIEGVLARAHPSAPLKRVRAVAHGRAHPADHAAASGLPVEGGLDTLRPGNLDPRARQIDGMHGEGEAFAGGQHIGELEFAGIAVMACVTSARSAKRT